MVLIEINHCFWSVFELYEEALETIWKGSGKKVTKWSGITFKWENAGGRIVIFA